MTTLADQLLKLGIATEKQAIEVVINSKLDSIEREPKKKLRDEFTLENLRQSKNMQTFKHMARTILERDIHQIEDILEIAHNLYDKDAGKKLFWILFQVKDGLKDLPLSKHAELLRRAFRKSGATPFVSEIKNKKK